MKTRPGFVSNSSTTSFCIYGAKTDVNEDNMTHEMYDYMCEAGLDFNRSEWDGHYIGASWDQIGEDETGGQFCRRVEAAAMKVDPTLTLGSFETYEEAYRDG
jgi:hypothetical protein